MQWEDKLACPSGQAAFFMQKGGSVTGYLENPHSVKILNNPFRFVDTDFLAFRRISGLAARGSEGREVKPVNNNKSSTFQFGKCCGTCYNLWQR